MGDLEKITKLEPQTINGIAMNVWNRIVGYKYRKVNPMELADFANDPCVHQMISKIIGEPVIKDIFYVHITVEDPALTDKEACHMILAHVFPNDIQIGDILMCNPYKPIPKNTTKHRFQKNEGFGVLKTILSNIDQVAHLRKCNYVTLTSASIDQYHLFSKYGFESEKNPSGRLFLELALAGHGGVPMEKKL